MLTMIGVFAFGGYFFYKYYTNRFDGGENIMAIAEGESAPVYIPTGATAEIVADQLLDEGLITDRDKFMVAANKLNYSGSNVVPGLYLLDGEFTVRDLVVHLRVGRGREEVQFQIGDDIWTLEQLCGSLSNSLEFDSTTCISYLTNPETHDKYGLNEKTIISMFYANTYRNNWAIPIEGLCDYFADQYKDFWTDERKAKAKEIGLSQSEVATMASIVYRECGNGLKHEWKTVAGLYMNRYKKGMKLQADPTVKYANGLYNQRRVYHRHLATEHPYNTYVVKGLPPGPISTFPKDVLDAVLNYEKHNYLYMCAKPGGFSKGHNFAITGAQHERNAAAYHRWLRNNNIN